MRSSFCLSVGVGANAYFGKLRILNLTTLALRYRGLHHRTVLFLHFAMAASPVPKVFFFAFFPSSAPKFFFALAFAIKLPGLLDDIITLHWCSLDFQCNTTSRYRALHIRGIIIQLSNFLAALGQGYLGRTDVLPRCNSKKLKLVSTNSLSRS